MIAIREEEFAERLAAAVQAERQRIVQSLEDHRDAALGRGEWAVASELSIVIGVIAAVPEQPAPPRQTSDDEDAEIAVQQLRHTPHPVLGVPRD